jgi:transcriptional regulator with XRE-family HTH domain
LDYTNSDYYSQEFPAVFGCFLVDKSISSSDYKLFLRYLRSVRQHQGVTQVELAASLGETQSFVSKCERGERRIDVMELRAFCGALGLTLMAFIQGLEKSLSTEAQAHEKRK